MTPIQSMRSVLAIASLSIVLARAVPPSEDEPHVVFGTGVEDGAKLADETLRRPPEKRHEWLKNRRSTSRDETRHVKRLMRGHDDHRYERHDHEHYYGGMDNGRPGNKRKGRRYHYHYDDDDDDDDYYDSESTTYYSGRKSNKRSGGKRKKGGSKYDSKYGSKYGKSKYGKSKESGPSKPSKPHWPTRPPKPTLPPWHPPVTSPTPAPTQPICYDHREILLDFYDRMGGDNWFQTTGWGEDWIIHCHWYGVVCAVPQSFCVTGLHLPENNLNGPLELTRIDDIHTLVSLDLAGNRNGNDFTTGVYGSFPMAWNYDNFHHLVYLDLSRNSLSGIIPSAITGMVSLHQMYLRDNQLGLFAGAAGVGTIPTELGEMKSLGIVDLQTNQLGGLIPTELGMLYHMGVLQLQGNVLLVGDISGDHPICQLRINYAGSPGGRHLQRGRSSNRHGGDNGYPKYHHNLDYPLSHRPQNGNGQLPYSHKHKHTHYPDHPGLPNPGYPGHPHPELPLYPMYPGMPRPPPAGGVLSVLEMDCDEFNPPATAVICDCCTACF